MKKLVRGVVMTLVALILASAMASALPHQSLPDTIEMTLTSLKAWLTNGGQGSIPYYSATDQITALAKSTSSTRVLTNTGTDNNPAWAQLDLTTGVTGVLPVANGGSGGTALTQGSVVFAGSSGTLSQSNANFFFNATANTNYLKLGSGTGPGALWLLEGSGTGTNKGILTCGTNLASDFTWTLPSATDTLVGKATTDTFTNKTYDTAGSGNAFSINGTAISAVAGTGAVVLANTPTLITPNVGAATGVSLAVTGAITSSGTAGIGYAAGAGGTVTQATDKTTTVVLHKICGQITTANTILNATTTVSFTMTNSTIAATDMIVLNHVSGGTVGSYLLNGACGSGSAVIYLTNVTLGNLTEQPVIRFNIVKGSNT